MSIVTILILGLVAKWILSSWPRGSDLGGEIALRDAELRRLRDEVDVLQSEVRRLGEEQSFMVRLLSPGTVPKAEAAVVPPHDSNPENP